MTRRAEEVDDGGSGGRSTRSQDALREVWRQWENFARAQELGQIGWWRLDMASNALTWSAENYRIFGAPLGSPQTYETFLATVHPDDRAYVHEKWTAALCGAPYDIEHRLLVGGQEKWVHEKACLEFDEKGALLSGFGVTQDITDRKNAEIALQWSVRRNELLSKLGARLLQAGDAQEIVEELCAEVMQFLDCQVFFNYLLDERVGRLRLNACAGIPPEEAQKIEWLDYGVAVCGCVARDGKRIIAENIPSLGDERTALVESYGVKAYCCHPLMSQGGLIGTLSFGTKTRATFTNAEIEVMQAVTQLVTMAMTRLKMEQALREADRRKDEFLATLSHELRNPLAPVRTGLMLLKRIGGQGPQAVRVQEMMQRQVDHIVRLVDDLLEVSRIRSGKIDLRKERIDLSAIIDQAVEASQSFFDANGVKLTINKPEAPLMVDADPVRLVQVAVNLLNNAAKFTEAGGWTEIAAMRDGEEALLIVSDNGVGIPGEMLPRVFDLFVQAHGTRARAQGGLGIGLEQVRTLVRLHGGDVSAESAGQGRGSRFTVRLPLSCGKRQGEQKAPIATGEQRVRRVLVVDDNEDAAECLAMLLRERGASVHVAFNGESALRAVRELQPEIIFLDLGMPGMDGYETARAIRASAEGRDATLAALTGWGGDEVREKGREAGFDVHVTKPASLADIERALNIRR
jgi:signal transduction histidine kinase